MAFLSILPISPPAFMPVCNLEKLAILNSNFKYYWMSPMENCCTMAHWNYHRMD